MEHREIRIDGSHRIGPGRTFVIAEVGSNHCQDMGKARESIAAAAACGADAVKFQSIALDELYFAPGASTRALHARIDLAESWHGELKAACDGQGLVFFSSPTYLRAVDILASLGVDLYKLASAQIGVFPQLVAKVAGLGKPTLMSTGLVTPGGLEATVAMFRRAGNNAYGILHCNAIYPTPPNRVCLERMDVLRALYACPVGFSDHTGGTAVALAAVARGAEVIEKHFTLDRALDSPDAFFSLEPHELGRLVADIREVEAACAPCDARLDIEAEEDAFKRAIRHRLVLRRDKEAGEAFFPGDFDYKRHDRGVDCADETLVLTRMQAKQAIEAGELLAWDMLEGRA